MCRFRRQRTAIHHGGSPFAAKPDSGKALSTFFGPFFQHSTLTSQICAIWLPTVGRLSRVTQNSQTNQRRFRASLVSLSPRAHPQSTRFLELRVLFLLLYHNQHIIIICVIICTYTTYLWFECSLGKMLAICCLPFRNDTDAAREVGGSSFFPGGG